MKAPIVHQGILINQLRSIFPNQNILEETRKETQLKYDNNKSYFMELDVCIPNLNLAFEFQDTYHYQSMWYSSHPLSYYKGHDSKAKKKEVTRQNRLTLIVVPCWWDGKVESLVSSIAFQRPDLLENYYSSSIPLNPPTGFFPAVEIPGVGELMLSSFPNESEFRSSIIPNSWWMGEKYDGIRFCLNSDHHKIYTRKGNGMVLLESVQSHLPSCFSEGEIWFGRNLFSYASALILQVGLSHIPWNLFRMIAFDAPSIRMQNKPFEERYEYLLESLSFTHPFAIIAPRVLCSGSSHLKLFITSIIKDEGEGAILRRIRSLYEYGRSSSLVKLKSSQIDTEALVVKVEKDIVTLQLPSGHQVTIVSSLTVNRGDIVTVSFPLLSHRASLSTISSSSSSLLSSNSSTSTSPSIPMLVITRVRNDLSWEDVISNAQKDKENVVGLLQIKDFIQDYDGLNRRTKKISKDWTKIKNRRKFFEEFASSRGFDPLSSENWYTKGKTVKYSKDFLAVVWHHKNSMSQALVDLFPEIGLEKEKFFNWPYKYKKERRKFFEEYAAEHKFDPLIPSNWYHITPVDLLNKEGANSVLAYHGSQISKALIELFPEVTFDHLTLLTTFELSVIHNRRKVFEEYARENNFDPLVPDNWYSQPRQRMLEIKSIKNIIMYHDRSISKALVDLFPEIGLVRNKFQFSQRIWHKTSNQREFLLNFAKNNNFDPLEPENWYSLSVPALMESKIIRTISSYHGHSLPQTLVDLFPDAGLIVENFQNTQKLYGNSENRKMFFEEYAKENRFDPLVADNWYLQPSERIWAKKGAHRVLFYHNRSIQKALMDLFPNIGLTKSKFSRSSSLLDHATMRQFFETFAKKHGFNPLIPVNWYSQSKQKILNATDGLVVLSFFKLNIPNALLTLFPEIGLEIHRFKLAK